MKTLATFKKELKDGTIKTLTQTFSVHKKDFIGLKRTVSKVQTNAITLKLADTGKESWLYYPVASLFEYDGNTIKIYAPGVRDLTKEEQAIMDEWTKITQTEEYERQLRIDLLTDCSTTYHQKKRFFEDKKAEHLLGYEKVRGMKYNSYINKVTDDKIKGDIEFIYLIN
ncbi:MAG: hypothetical protein BWY51_01022 [Parcubacteria group bacterium ADurb.Bin316]|nr:MAG: hypothetical protein BWY51_01022 [Parcubacteria group bacterium ADurb.Bin316]